MCKLPARYGFAVTAVLSAVAFISGCTSQVARPTADTGVSLDQQRRAVSL